METYTKKCPECGKTQEYTNKGNLQRAVKKQLPCRECCVSARDVSGDKNPFYGRKHTDELKTKLSNDRKGKCFSPATQFVKGQQTLNKKPVYDCWVEKFGKVDADLRMDAVKAKQSAANSGTKNPMYGKASPLGSGNGWSGWYKGWYFRSLGELAFMVKVIERFRFDWKTMESKGEAIPWVAYDGTERNYFPDFLLNNKYLVEVKPKRLWGTPSVNAKTEAAKAHCKEKDWKFKLMDVQKLTLMEIVSLVETTQLIWLPRYQTKYETLILNAKNS